MSNNQVAAIKSVLTLKAPDLSKLVPREQMASFMAAVLTNLKPTNAQGKPNKLLFCTPASFYGAAHQCAMLGLTPGTLGHAYLVPYGKSATMILGYKGMMELARRHPAVAKITAEIVYKDDQFRHDKATGIIEHGSPCDVDDSDDAVVGAYCRVKLRDEDEPITYFMSRSKIEKVRQRSAGRDGNFWNNDFQAMARKCPIRALFNGGSVPCSTQLQQGLEYEQEEERRALILSVKDEPREALDVETVDGFAPDEIEAAEELASSAEGDLESAVNPNTSEMRETVKAFVKKPTKAEVIAQIEAQGAQRSYIDEIVAEIHKAGDVVPTDWKKLGLPKLMELQAKMAAELPEL